MSHPEVNHDLPPAPECPDWCTEHLSHADASWTFEGGSPVKRCRWSVSPGNDLDGDSIVVALDRFASVDDAGSSRIGAPCIDLEVGPLDAQAAWALAETIRSMLGSVGWPSAA